MPHPQRKGTAAPSCDSRQAGNDRKVLTCPFMTGDVSPIHEGTPRGGVSPADGSTSDYGSSRTVFDTGVDRDRSSDCSHIVSVIHYIV